MSTDVDRKVTASCAKNVEIKKSVLCMRWLDIQNDTENSYNVHYHSICSHE